MKEGKSLNDLEIYTISLKLSSLAWDVFRGLDKNLQFSIGNQFLRSTDSIGANIAEGFGRFHYKDSLKFYYNARASLFETKHWLELLKNRNLIEQNIYDGFKNDIDILGVKLNNFMNYLKSRIQSSK